MEDPIIRPAMLPFLLYQRTQYAWPHHRTARRILGRVRLYGLYWRFAAPLIDRARKPAIAALYRDELTRELQEIEPHLPAASGAILDIGCGLAGIDLLLYRRYAGAAELHLLDKEGVSHIYYGFEKEAANYNNASLTRAFLTDNGVPANRLHFYDAQKNEFPADVRFDLVFSSISWGFHYAIGTYLDRVAAVLGPGGRVIVDVRKGTDGLEALARRFRRVKTIAEDTKRLRVVATDL